MLKIKSFNRFQAFGLHLLGSMLVALFSSTLIFLLWYRWPLPVATGVTAIFAILLTVDVVMGPIITLVVFDTAKKALKWDLSIVLLLQIGALLVGLHAVFIARPVYMVFNANRFDLVYANDLDEKKLSKVSDPQFKNLPILHTEVIAARLPELAERNEIMFSAIKGGGDIPQLPQYYVPYAVLKSEVQKHIGSLDELKAFNTEYALDIDGLRSKYSSIKEGIGFLPLRGKVKDLTVIVRRDTAEVLAVKDLRPWKE